MSGNTKATLAIVFGVVGILLGGLGTLTAYNAKKAVDSDSSTTAEVQALVEQKFQEAQARQDQIEASQKSDAERLVAQLNSGEKTLIGKINGNQRKIRQLSRQNRKLKNQVSSLNSRDSELTAEIAQAESGQQQDFDQLNGRINRQNSQIQQLQRQVANLRGLAGN